MHKRPIRRREVGGFSTPASALHELPPCGIKARFGKISTLCGKSSASFSMSQRYPTQRRPLFGVVTELAGVWEPCGVAAEDESGSQQHGKEASRIDFLWASFS